MRVGEYYKLCNAKLTDKKGIITINSSSKLCKFINICRNVIIDSGYSFDKGVWYISNDSYGTYRLYMNSAYYGTVSIEGFVDKEFRDLVFELNGLYPYWKFFVFSSDKEVSWWDYWETNSVITYVSDFDMYNASRVNLEVFLTVWNDKKIISPVGILAEKVFMGSLFKVISKCCNKDNLADILNDEYYTYGRYKSECYNEFYGRVLSVSFHGVKYKLSILY